jgi:NADPH-dependent glutamate synthase beta subunit-like oxidoreductase
MQISVCSSSIRYKTNLKRFDSGLELIKRLRPVAFNWKSNNVRDLGLVAEDVAKVEPLLVTHNENGQVEGVKYDRVGVVLVNAVNEQQTEIENQQKQINTQKELIQRQQSEIEALKKLICVSHRAAKACRAAN